MLTPQQLDEFLHLGIVRVRGALTPEVAAAMCDSVWDMMSRRYNIQRAQPATWKGQRIVGTKDRPKEITLEQVLNPLHATLHQLLAPAEWECDAHWGSLLVSFPGGRFPEARHGWEVPHTSWHFDAPLVRALPELYGVRIFTCLAQLSPQGGATLAVAGSPRLAQALAKARGMAKLRSADLRKGLKQRYDWMNALCTFDPAIDRMVFMKTTARLEDIDVRVVEMTGEPGDVYLMHPLMMHAASPNCLAMPRIVLSSTVYQRGVNWSLLYGPEREAAA